MNTLVSLKDAATKPEAPLAAETAVPVLEVSSRLDRPPEPGPEIQPPAPPTRERSGRGRKIFAILAAIAIAAFAFWKHQAAFSFLNDFVPYAGTMASFAAGIIPLCFRDWRKYHPVIAYGLFVTFCVLASATGVNAYRERLSAARERQTAADERRDAGEEKKKNAKIIANLEESVRTLRKSVDDVSGSVNKANPEALRAEMDGLQTTMQKVVNPPKADLLFSFGPLTKASRDADNKFVPQREVTLPLKPDGSVEMHITLINNTEVPADGAQVAVEICKDCKFTKEPAKMMRVAGSSDEFRNHVYGDMPAGVPFEELVIDVTPPPNVPGFIIEVTHRCKTCVLQRAGTKGTVYIQRN